MDPQPHLEKLFPGLRNASYRVTASANERYNCIAHVADSDDAWWQPAPEPTKKTYWPPGVSEEWTLDSLTTVFVTLGYLPCDNPTLESGFEKIALYADATGEPTHAARQRRPAPGPASSATWNKSNTQAWRRSKARSTAKLCDSQTTSRRRMTGCPMSPE
jgi:hypothetical protein